MDLGDFAKQVPIQIPIITLLAGAAYIISMVYILRRARARRQREHEAALPQGVAPPEKLPEKQASGIRVPALSFGSFLRGEVPNHSQEPAPWTVPAELRGMPEPDLDMLASPVLIAADTAVPSDEARAIAQPIVQQEPSIQTEAAQYDYVEALGAEAVPVASEPTSVESTEDAMVQTAPSGDVVEVMRVYRDLSDGNLIIEIGGRRFRSMSEIQGADLTRRFTSLMRDLDAMAESAAVRPADRSAPIPPPDNSAGGMKARIGLLSREPEAPKPNVAKGFARVAMGQTPAPQAPEEPAGIASAVEEFLQFKLTSTPQLAARSIHISAAHDHSIRIEVDGHYYESIGDVVDPDVREFLFSMMREWEARH